MFESITNTVIAIPALRGIITVAEILLTGFALYWLWEMVLKLSSRLGKNNIETAKARPETTAAHTPKVSAGRRSIVGVRGESESGVSPSVLDPTS